MDMTISSVYFSDLPSHQIWESCQRGPESQRDVSNTLWNHVELRLFWQQSRILPGISLMFLIKWVYTVSGVRLCQLSTKSLFYNPSLARVPIILKLIRHITLYCSYKMSLSVDLNEYYEYGHYLSRQVTTSRTKLMSCSCSWGLDITILWSFFM